MNELALNLWAFGEVFRTHGIPDRILYRALGAQPRQGLWLSAEYTSGDEGRIHLFVGKNDSAVWGSVAMPFPISRTVALGEAKHWGFLKKGLRKFYKAHANCRARRQGMVQLRRKGVDRRRRLGRYQNGAADVRLECACGVCLPWSYVWRDGTKSWAPFNGVDPVAKARRYHLPRRRDRYMLNEPVEAVDMGEPERAATPEERFNLFLRNRDSGIDGIRVQPDTPIPFLSNDDIEAQGAGAEERTMHLGTLITEFELTPEEEQVEVRGLSALERVAEEG